MKLTRKHIGKLFDVHGSDGSWCYQLLDIRKRNYLFRSLDGRYEIESRRFDDWRPFRPGKVTAAGIRFGWKIGRHSQAI